MEIENQKKPEGIRENGRFVKGSSGNLKGRKPDTPEQKLIKKARKDLVKKYTDELADILEEIPKVLRKLASQGDIQAIKEINNRVMGLPTATVAGDKENPVVFITKEVAEKNDIAGYLKEEEGKEAPPAREEAPSEEISKEPEEEQPREQAFVPYEEEEMPRYRYQLKNVHEGKEEPDLSRQFKRKHRDETR